MRRKSKLARPYIWRLGIFSRLICILSLIIAPRHGDGGPDGVDVARDAIGEGGDQHGSAIPRLGSPVIQSLAHIIPIRVVGSDATRNDGANERGEAPREVRHAPAFRILLDASERCDLFGRKLLLRTRHRPRHRPGGCQLRGHGPGAPRSVPMPQPFLGYLRRGCRDLPPEGRGVLAAGAQTGVQMREIRIEPTSSGAARRAFPGDVSIRIPPHRAPGEAGRTANDGKAFTGKEARPYLCMDFASVGAMGFAHIRVRPRAPERLRALAPLALPGRPLDLQHQQSAETPAGAQRLPLDRAVLC